MGLRRKGREAPHSGEGGSGETVRVFAEARPSRRRPEGATPLTLISGPPGAIPGCCSRYGVIRRLMLVESTSVADQPLICAPAGFRLSTRASTRLSYCHCSSSPHS
eukprot:scaffold897_cov402-Prasinococcus_capsulatus_cf.AAC.45